MSKLTVKSAIGRSSKLVCTNKEEHTPCPEGYIQWHAWAEKMSKTHKQIRCEGCNLYTIWIPKAKRSTND